jgi:uncharacterized protein YegL
VDARSASDKHIAGLGADRFTAALGDKAIQVENVGVAGEEAEGTAYVLLVDASGTMKGKPFEAAQQAARTLVAQLGKTDRMALIRFGDSVEVVVDFTADRDELKKGLEGIKPKDQKTRLFDAVDKALKKTQGAMSGFPKRRVIIVITDGRDEGSDSRLEELKNDNTGRIEIPIMAIWYSRIGSDGIDTLKRLRYLSHGRFFKGTRDPESILDAFKSLLSELKNTYAVQMKWGPPCKPDGSLKNFAMTLSYKGVRKQRRRKVLMVSSDKKRCLEPKKTTAARDESFLGRLKRLSRRWYFWVACGGLVLLIVVGLLLFRRKEQSSQLGDADAATRTAKVTESRGDSDELRRPGESGDVNFHKGERPRGSISLAVVRGEGKLSPDLEMYHLAEQGLVLGREGDISIVGDKEVSAEHCRLWMSHGHVMIKDLKSKNGTICNGIPVSHQERLETGDTIEVGRTTLRLEIKEEK